MHDEEMTSGAVEPARSYCLRGWEGWKPRWELNLAGWRRGRDIIASRMDNHHNTRPMYAVSCLDLRLACQRESIGPVRVSLGAISEVPGKA